MNVMVTGNIDYSLMHTITGQLGRLYTIENTDVRFILRGNSCSNDTVMLHEVYLLPINKSVKKYNKNR